MTSSAIDIDSNRLSQKYSRKEILARVLWEIVRPFFYLSPRCFFGWRCFLLRLFGAQIGRNVHIYNSATIYMPWNLDIGDWSSIGEHAFVYNLGKITIGNKTTISHRAHLCAGTHDYRDRTLPLWKSPIIVSDCAWVCTDAFVGPDVTVGEGAIVGARSVVIKDVEQWSVVAGNPAQFIKKRSLEDEG